VRIVQRKEFSFHGFLCHTNKRTRVEMDKATESSKIEELEKKLQSLSVQVGIQERALRRIGELEKSIDMLIEKNTTLSSEMRKLDQEVSGLNSKVMHAIYRMDEKEGKMLQLKLPPRRDNW
jgi:peptidoglycan hydrolase CwlO-like protein